MKHSLLLRPAPLLSPTSLCGPSRPSCHQTSRTFAGLSTWNPLFFLSSTLANSSFGICFKGASPEQLSLDPTERKQVWVWYQLCAPTAPSTWPTKALLSPSCHYRTRQSVSWLGCQCHAGGPCLLQIPRESVVSEAWKVLNTTGHRGGPLKSPNLIQCCQPAG